MIYLKKYILKLADEKELKLLGRTQDKIRDVERKMEREESDLDSIVNDLKKIQELHEEFDKDDWREVEKEVEKMLK